MSLPCPPTIDRPTGSSSAVAPGKLISGTPVSPPWLHRESIRSFRGSSVDNDCARLGAGNGVVGPLEIFTAFYGPSLFTADQWATYFGQERLNAAIENPPFRRIPVVINPSTRTVSSQVLCVWRCFRAKMYIAR